MVKVGIVGGTGYTGVELLRLLATHPQVEVKQITSRAEAGRQVSELYGNLRGHFDLAFSEPDPAALARCDLVFFATPNGTAMKMVPELLAAGARVIDLAADFRLQDTAVWEEWYGMPHACPAYLAEAVYGLPEIHRKAVREARLVANPGCYPTAVQLGLLPLIEQLEERHYAKLPYNDDLSSQHLDNYLNSLDRSKMFFTAADIAEFALGSLLSGGGGSPLTGNTPQDWADMVDRYQSVALSTRLGIPLIQGF